jgi:hypothetical protein
VSNSAPNSPREFDVFLSYNSKDKPTVRQLAERLQAQGLRVWFDEWHLIPGLPWQRALEAGIESSHSVAVLVGSDGLGPWTEEEMEGALLLAVREGKPVIPVLLPDAPAKPKLPMFLQTRTWVDLRSGLTDDALSRLAWGITGNRPHGTGAQGETDASGGEKSRKRGCTLTVVLTLCLTAMLGGAVVYFGGGGGGVEYGPPVPQVIPLGATKAVPFVNSLGMKFVPAGTDGVLFCMWETRVKDYAAFAAATKHEVEQPSFAQTGDHPVVNVSWEDARAFCKWLSGKESRKYRLPTDAEWSAAVGLPKESGTTPKENDEKIQDIFPWGTTWPPPKGAGNFADVSRKIYPQAPIIDGYDDGFADTAPVGSFAVNRFGLFDISGNVWEWCEDWYNRENKLRVLRGGSFWDDQRHYLLSSCRYQNEPAKSYVTIGFRVVVAGASSSP